MEFQKSKKGMEWGHWKGLPDLKKKSEIFLIHEGEKKGRRGRVDVMRGERQGGGNTWMEVAFGTWPEWKGQGAVLYTSHI